MSILDLATYKTLTNTTDTTNDTFITNIIPTVQSAMENYCDRHFDRQLYSRWFYLDNELNYLVLPEYPITDILFVGTKTSAATLTITGNYSVQVKSDRVTITTLLDLSQDDYLFTSYTTLAALKNEIESDYVGVITITIESGKDSTLSKFLFQVSGTNWYIAEKIDIDLHNVDGTERTVSIPYSYWTTLWNDCYSYYNNIYLIFYAGYTSATMPLDLQMIAANIIRDMITANASPSLGIYKSESITNYSYTLNDATTIKNILWQYSNQLDQFTKKGLF